MTYTWKKRVMMTFKGCMGKKKNPIGQGNNIKKSNTLQFTLDFSILFIFTKSTKTREKIFFHEKPATKKGEKIAAVMKNKNQHC